MSNNNGHYMIKYLKNNAIVLLCELIVVLLLGLICTIILGGEPMWLAPLLAVIAYFMAELRFMMAYVATNVRRDRANEGKEADRETAAPAEFREEREGDEGTSAATAEMPQSDAVAQERTVPPQNSIDVDEQDETLDELFAVSAQEEPVRQKEQSASEPQTDASTASAEMEAIMDDDGDFTMQDDTDVSMDDGQELARDVLDIGEIDEK